MHKIGFVTLKQSDKRYNKHLGDLLREYIMLPAESMRLHNLLIANSTFLLSTTRPKDNGVEIQSMIRKHLQDSHTLQSKMRIFQGVWEANRAQISNFRCYSQGLH